MVGQPHVDSRVAEAKKRLAFVMLHSFRAVIPKLWPVGHFWPAASYKMVCQDLWLHIFYLHHISV